MYIYIDSNLSILFRKILYLTLGKRGKRGKSGTEALTTTTKFYFENMREEFIYSGSIYGYFEEDVLFTYGTLKRRSHFYEDVADSIHMLQRRSGFHAIFTNT